MDPSYPIPNTFEVLALNRQFVVFVDGVHVASYVIEADALANCARLERQAAADTGPRS
jgi:hypothetical protein